MTKKTFMLQKLLTVEISRDWWWISQKHFRYAHVLIFHLENEKKICKNSILTVSYGGMGCIAFIYSDSN